MTNSPPRNQYLVKINGEKRCPRGISRPKAAADWEGGEIRVEAVAPSYARAGGSKAAPDIQRGDGLWIWTHEDEKFGRGLGLTASATAGDRRAVGDEVAIKLHDVNLLARPIGFRTLGNEETESHLINYVRKHRHRLVYLIEDEDRDAFLSVVRASEQPLPDDKRYPNDTPWAKYIRDNKKDMLDALTERKLSWQKSRPLQAEFRAALMEAYGGRCVLTKCSIPEALEAAHILPHNGDQARDQIDNGLLLRRNLHSMFDAMLWSIDPATNQVKLSKHISDRTYAAFDRKQINHHAAPEPLRFHYAQFEKANKNV